MPVIGEDRCDGRGRESMPSFPPGKKIQFHSLDCVYGIIGISNTQPPDNIVNTLLMHHDGVQPKSIFGVFSPSCQKLTRPPFKISV